MEKEWYKSKTIWGFGIALIVAGLQAMEVFDPSVVTELVKYLAAILGVVGVRDAID